MKKKRPNLTLFTRRRLIESDADDDDDKSETTKDRPLTATLDKPKVLNVSLLGQIDMTLIRKEFLLTITNLCRAPYANNVIASFDGKKSDDTLSSSSSSLTPLINLKNSRKTVNPTTVSVSDRKKKRPPIKSPSTSDNSSSTPTSIVLRKPQKKKIKPIQLMSSDAKTILNLSPKIFEFQMSRHLIDDCNNNNNNHDYAARQQCNRKLLEPCRSCGRPDLPERLHSHPINANATVKMDKTPLSSSSMIPKNIVRKPVAIKYRQQRDVPVKSVDVVDKNLTLKLKRSTVKDETSRDLKRLSSGKGTRLLTCYLCGREFGSASLPLHEPKCLQVRFFLS